MFSKIIALALAVGLCQAEQNWIRGGTTCIGIDSTKPKTAMIGPCTQGSKADAYISQELMGAALLANTASYMAAGNDPAQIKMVAEANPGMSASRAAMNQKGNEGCEFAAAQASLKLEGDVTVQFAAVINTGSGVCEASKIEVVQPRAADDTKETLTNGICIDSTSPGTTCAVEEFAAGALKFSAGVAFGNTFAANPEVSANVAATHLGYRLKYDFESFGDGAVLTYNSAVMPANLAYAQVDSFTVTTKDGSKAATVTLDPTYSYGTMTAGVFTKVNVGTIAKRSFPVTGSSTSIYVDFIFDAQWATPNAYIMYDPTFTSTGGSVASSSSHVVASAFTVALLAAVASLV